MNLDNNPESVFGLNERETSVNSKPSKRPGLDILGKLSHQMSSALIAENLYFQVTRCYVGPVRVPHFP